MIEESRAYRLHSEQSVQAAKLAWSFGYERAAVALLIGIPRVSQTDEEVDLHSRLLEERRRADIAAAANFLSVEGHQTAATFLSNHLESAAKVPRLSANEFETKLEQAISTYPRNPRASEWVKTAFYLLAIGITIVVSLVVFRALVPPQTFGGKGEAFSIRCRNMDTLEVSAETYVSSVALGCTSGTLQKRGTVTADKETLRCPANTTAIGIAGSAGVLIDRVGLLCRDGDGTTLRTREIGGSGGQPFHAECKNGQKLHGLRVKEHSFIAALGIYCR